MSNSTVFYPNSLAMPIILPLGKGVQQDRLISEMYESKMEDLFAHYGLNRGNECHQEQLLWLLAINHVPGFKPVYPGVQPIRKRGQKVQWKGSLGMKLYFDVALLRLDGFSLSRACEVLAKRECFRPLRAASLRQGYHRVLKGWTDCHRRDIEQLTQSLLTCPDLGRNLLSAYAPDGTAILQNPAIAQTLVLLFGYK